MPRKKSKGKAEKGSKASSPKGQTMRPERLSNPSSGIRPTEMLFRAIDRIASDKGFESSDELQAFLNEHIVGRPLEEIARIAGLDSDPHEQAMALVAEADSVDSPEEALKLAEKALEIDPGNIDARLIQVTIMSGTQDDAIAKVRRIIADTEEAFGPEFMAENKGHFWGIVETRPYMRARMELLDLLYEDERIDEAIAEAEIMLDLNPNDNQGVRDRLLPMYLEKSRLEDARRLLARYEKDYTAIHAFGSVIERFLSGDLEGAVEALKEAHEINPHVLAYLSGRKKLSTSLPMTYSLGGKEEAHLCIIAYVPVIMAHESAGVFLVAAGAQLLPEKKPRLSSKKGKKG